MDCASAYAYPDAIFIGTGTPEMLALKISYMNDIANLCELVDANIEDVTEGIKCDWRIGNLFLDVGIGYGGNCFPKDTKALCYLASKYGYKLRTVDATVEMNKERKTRYAYDPVGINNFKRYYLEGSVGKGRIAYALNSEKVLSEAMLLNIED